ncbi:leucine-rich repeat and calponin homology domain-containing protein isoform X7 [Lepeophtheirus salmonis]|uniref:leucine-rich repeat and calponin homology domain-containing protein isoform X7 n=1 Tax=Lepeophtheirus salmonis TaxID=72036 RepID=UPI001AE2134E|nr:leucine-rich repeat and calponin homology domain-containing protein 1-like isoform X5 [Lepeophtheirus salmonis]
MMMALSVAASSSPTPPPASHHSQHPDGKGGVILASSLSLSLEKLLDQAETSGELKLSGRNLKSFPRAGPSKSYNYLRDTVVADLSRNKLNEVPDECTKFSSMEKFLLYHNTIKSIPDSIIALHSLQFLDLSRNQLSYLPANLCQLPLQGLIVNNNRLVSLPEEIGKMQTLMELDASCNEIAHLPVQIGDLSSLKCLKLRRNHLQEIPVEISYLQLSTLDLSGNRISILPVELRFMTSVIDINLEENPLTCPPANLCSRGRIHIYKYLEIQAIKEDRRRGVLTDSEYRRSFRKTGTNQLSDMGFNNMFNCDPRRKRNTADSGYGSEQPLERRWSQDFNQEMMDGMTISNERNHNKPTGDFVDSTSQERSVYGHNSSVKRGQYKEQLRQQRNNGSNHDYSNSNEIPPPLSEEQQSNDIKSRLSSHPHNHITHGHGNTMKLGKHNGTSSSFAYSYDVKTMQKEAVLSFVKSKSNGSSNTVNSSKLPSSSGIPQPSLNSSSRLKMPQHSNTTTTIDQNRTFTARREAEKSATSETHIQQLKMHLENRLRLTLPDDISGSLVDGVILCHMANHVKPRSVPSIHVPSPAVPKLTSAKCRKNVENFLLACRKIGVRDEDLFDWDNVSPLPDLERILTTLLALEETLYSAQISSSSCSDELVGPLDEDPTSLAQPPHYPDLVPIEETTNMRLVNSQPNNNINTTDLFLNKTTTTTTSLQPQIINNHNNFFESFFLSGLLLGTVLLLYLYPPPQ